MPCERCADGSMVCTRGPDPCSEFEVVDVMSHRMSMEGQEEVQSVDEDRCHEISVLVMDNGGQCRARLWVGPPDPPPGWSNLGCFTIRVRAGKDVSGNCAAKINWEGCPEC